MHQTIDHYKLNRFLLILICIFSNFLLCNSKIQDFSSYLDKLIINETSKLKLNFLENKDLLLNISDFSVNAILFMAQRGLNLDITAKNDTSNPLPLNIDTQSLNLLVEELKKYSENLNMTMRIYENATVHPVPKIYSDPDGALLTLSLGMQFSIYDSSQSEPTELLSFDLPVKLKIQLEDTNNKLSIGISWIQVGSLNINYDALNVNQERLRISMENFIGVAYSGVKSSLTNIDVLGKIYELTGFKYTNLDVISDYGYNLIHISE